MAGALPIIKKEIEAYNLGLQNLKPSTPARQKKRKTTQPQQSTRTQKKTPTSHCYPTDNRQKTESPDNDENKCLTKAIAQKTQSRSTSEGLSKEQSSSPRLGSTLC
jgi:hypothetical protein